MKMKLSFVHLFTIISLASLVSCDYITQSIGNLTGNTTVNEKQRQLLIVLPHHLVRTPVEKDIVQPFQTYQKYMGLQSELLFDITIISEKDFYAPFNQRASIIIIDEADSVNIAVKNEVWSKYQKVVIIEAPLDSLPKITQNISSQILKVLTNAEQKRLIEGYTTMDDHAQADYLHEKYNLEIIHPYIFEKIPANNNFDWYAFETPKTTLRLFYFSHDRIEPHAIQADELLKLYNAEFKKHVPGPLDGSYMTTEEQLPINVHYSEIISANYHVEVRGAWKVQGAVMGGVFVSKTLYDSKNHKLVTIFGSVYGPGEKKRDNLERLAAIINTARIASND